jgi:hypothetical protein
MSEKDKPFVVTDRRKFTMDGEPRLDADPSPEPEPRQFAPEPVAAAPEPPTPTFAPEPAEMPEDADAIAGPTEEQSAQAAAAYNSTIDRLDTAIRAANPGMDHPPTMSFDQIVQSVYMSAVVQLGGSTPEGQQPQVDLMGARQSIDMLSTLAEKTKGNLVEPESRLLDSALFELRIAFLEITQALARSATAKAPGGQGPVPGRSGPSIVR